VGIAGAILPGPVLVGCFLWLNRYTPSPPWLIVVVFLWGAGVATSGALVVNTLMAHLLPDTIVATVTAPITEESLKAALPLLLFAFYRRAFTGITDGVVYCGLSATGFAMVENILYVGGHGFAVGSHQGGFVAGAFYASLTFAVRIPLSGFAHPLFTSMTGIGIGVAARSPRAWVRRVVPFAGLFLAMVLHGSWNLMATLSANDQSIILYGYFALFVPLFFTQLGLILWVRSWEGRLVERVLPAYVVRGWFSPPEIAALVTLGRRTSARRWAQRVAGNSGLAAMKAYQYAATRLALLRDGLDRGLYRPAAIAGAVAEEQNLLATLLGSRQAFVGRDPVTPRAWWNGSGYQIRFPDGVVRPVPPPPLPVVPVPIPVPMPMPPPYGPVHPAGGPPGYR
jgi:RsiW-degrading membrane proteinase PrsW (M82 family)